MNSILLEVFFNVNQDHADDDGESEGVDDFGEEGAAVLRDEIVYDGFDGVIPSQTGDQSEARGDVGEHALFDEFLGGFCGVDDVFWAHCVLDKFFPDSVSGIGFFMNVFGVYFGKKFG